MNLLLLLFDAVLLITLLGLATAGLFALAVALTRPSASLAPRTTTERADLGLEA